MYSSLILRDGCPAPRGGLVAAVLLSVVAGGCNTPGMEAPPDLSMCDGGACIGCRDTECEAVGEVCDHQSGACVACLDDSQCGAGRLCHLQNHTCLPGCSAVKGCGDGGGVCQLDAGLCVECHRDDDCAAPTPRCDGARGRCAACRPIAVNSGDSDGCAPGQYCRTAPGGVECSAGCNNDVECQSGADGGVGDGGGPDGGTGPAPVCDESLHQCVECSEDRQCPLGMLCHQNRCGAGCTEQHGCAAPSTCCDGACTNVLLDSLHCGACRNACDNGVLCCAGICRDPATDTSNCGACGVTCSTPNGSPLCNGACRTGRCDTGWGDCNRDAVDGCETNLLEDAEQCGACGSSCSRPNARTGCRKGQCVIETCLLPSADCDQQVPNGCEVTLTSDVDNCGACGVVCSGLHVPTRRCNNRVCDGACESGWSDCNADKQRDGCEIHTDGDPGHCGACGTVCSRAHGAASCQGGRCGITCEALFDNCDTDVRNGCEQELRTIDHCGACNQRCNLAHAETSCATGDCRVQACRMGFADCDTQSPNGCEVSTDTDTSHCGGCGRSCSAVNGRPACAGGVCTITCAPGFGDCDQSAGTGCETDLIASAANCGACGHLCALPFAEAECRAAQCGVQQANGRDKCLFGHANCDGIGANGCEIDLALDVLHCGDCQLACPSKNGVPTCANGSCRLACNGGFAECDGDPVNGCEVALASDPRNCGGCGAICSGSNLVAATCTAGECGGTCVAGFADCNRGLRADGCEASLLSDLLNCGACGHLCSAAGGLPRCDNGVCAITCADGWGDCDGDVRNGCETPTTSVTNCGGCGVRCSGNHVTVGVCSAGVCAGSCEPNWSDCDSNMQSNGCELNTGTDVNHCGGCNVVCSRTNAVPFCVAGACHFACNPRYADCNGDPADGCEINLDTNADHCGACRRICSRNHAAGVCVNGACGGLCDAGFGDCNHDLQFDGCEVSTNDDARNCGGCELICASNNVSAPSCYQGQCGGSCKPGFADCNKNRQKDGCEVELSTDPDHCGACDHACATANVVAVSRRCTGIACDVTCLAGFADCDGNKGDLDSNGCEINLKTDALHCGACNGACSESNMASTTCTGGACAGICSAGFGDCNNDKRSDGCEADFDKDDAHCGGCGMACSLVHVVGHQCINGSCSGACEAGYSNCDGRRRQTGCGTHTDGDASNCGGCGQVCNLPNVKDHECVAGACGVVTCDSGFGNCNGVGNDGCELAVSKDRDNCGACQSVCSGNHITNRACAGGLCSGACDPGFGDCDGDKLSNGCETDLLFTTAHCGACNNDCSRQPHVDSASCAAGSCNILQCSAGYGDCNLVTPGCETDILQTSAHCGACLNDCATLPNVAITSCTNGSCNVLTCLTGFGNCDKVAPGCETNIFTSPLHCGACGAACSQDHVVQASCANGSCTSTCSPGFLDCDRDVRGNGCEVSDHSWKACGCGRSVCPVGNFCASSACAKAAVCAVSRDLVTDASFTVCRMDAKGAWLTGSVDGVYHTGEICRQLGYTRVGGTGTTCGRTCGSCADAPRNFCNPPGTEDYDGAATFSIDVDLTPILGAKGEMVTWQCLP